MIDEPPEDPLEMERRHIVEGQARIDRQEEIIRQLVEGGTPALAITARQVLLTFRQSLALSKARLADLEQQERDKPLASD